MHSDSDNNKGKKLYVGNLPFSVDDALLRNFFEAALGPDTVQSAQVVIDRIRDRSKGFGFVVFVSEDISMKAIALNGQEIQGSDGVSRKISLDEARERAPRSFIDIPRPANISPSSPNNYGGGNSNNFRGTGGSDNNRYGGGGGFADNNNEGGWGR